MNESTLCQCLYKCTPIKSPFHIFDLPAQRLIIWVDKQHSYPHSSTVEACITQQEYATLPCAFAVSNLEHCLKGWFDQITYHILSVICCGIQYTHADGVGLMWPGFEISEIFVALNIKKKSLKMFTSKVKQ